VDRCHFFDRLQFDNDFAINQQINSKSIFENSTFVFKRYRDLRQNFQAPTLEFECKNCFIYGFEKSGAEISMNF